MQGVGGFVVQGYVVDGDLGAEDAGHVVDGAELGLLVDLVRETGG